MAKRKSYNNITNEQYQLALAWLADGNTKKGACEILKVSNNKTMERLLEEHTEGLENSKRLRAKKRKEPVKNAELVEIIMDYLNGFSLSELSDRHYRSVDMIKYHLTKNGAMLRSVASIDPANPPQLPDECLADALEIGEYVWSAKYGCIAQVVALYKGAYRIQIMGDGRQQQSYQPIYELGCLRHLTALGLDVSQLSDYMRTDEVNHRIAQTMREVNKQAKADAKHGSK